MVEERSCRHSNLTCINHYELIRKIRRGLWWRYGL